jgi:hypothetical protein
LGLTGDDVLRLHTWCTEPFRWFSAPAFVRTKKLRFFNAQAPLRLKCIDEDFESFVYVNALGSLPPVEGARWPRIYDVEIEFYLYAG